MKGKHKIRSTLRQCVMCGILFFLPWKELCAQEIYIPVCPTRIDSLLVYKPDRSFLRTVAEWLLPESVTGILAMKEFIRWEEFQSFRRDSGDLKTIDLIYQKGLQIAGGDIDLALFLCFIGTMDHVKIGVRVPLLGFVIFVPLTTESDRDFQIRHNCLPSHFYPDSPRGRYGDKDKLQHFFGSAFMAYLSGSRTYSRTLTNWSEVLEERYVVDGLDDPRDRRANRQGIQFGKLLFAGIKILPSDVLVDSVKIQEKTE